MVLILFLFLILTSLSYNFSNDYSPCPFRLEKENRILYVATCDTRSGWKEFVYMKPWNLTGFNLRQQGIQMKNVCKGGNWGKMGFLTKPLTYFSYLQSIHQLSKEEGTNIDLIHVILMDSDTFWSVNDVNKVWNKYDCARGNKHLVISTEMSCWMGRYCNADDLKRWYNNSKEIPSYSPFANSGIIMGRISDVSKMLEYVILNNQSYWTHYGRKYKFDDQYAIADYAIVVNPKEVALDYRQQISASFSVHASPIPADEGWPFVCKNRTGELSLSCPIYSNLVNKFGHYRVNSSSCLVHRSVSINTPFREELNSLAPDPLIWHGNGAGKNLFHTNAYNSLKCFLKRMNMTMEQYDNTFG